MSNAADKGHKLTNQQVVDELKEVLAAMEVKDFNKFRIRAYQNVISVIESLSMSVFNMWENNRISEIPGVGTTLADHLDELFRTGAVAEFAVIKKDLPDGMFSLIGLRGIGAKKAFKLATAFNLDNRESAIEDIKKIAAAGKIRNLEGFGEKSEKLILEAASEQKKTKNEKTRTLLFKAEQVVERVLEYLSACPEIQKSEVVGSFRRRKSTVGDIEFAIATLNPEVATNYFLKFPEITEVLVSGKTRSSVVLGDDLQVDIRVVDPKLWGSMLQYFTGSKAHNIVLRTYALDHGYSLSEYGIKQTSTGKVHEFAKEEEFYNFLKLDYIPPEIRQGKNEVELAQKHKLPKLIKISDIKGDLHTHTIASDGVATLSEMVDKARSLGYKYVGIADHAPSVQSRGYKEVEDIISKTKETISKLNDSQSDIKILYGYEVNILADATMAMPDELMSELDYVIAGLHTSYNQDRDQITHRIISALENPNVSILAHPSGRLINERDAYEVAWNEVFAAAKDNDKIIEINSQPNRLDLADDLVFEAINRAIPLIISTDAHATDQMDYMKYGINVARRGWCESTNIVNTFGVNEIIKLL